MNVKFSPGPWAIDGSVNAGNLDVINGEGRIAMIDDSRSTGWNMPTINANARLIASAPELFACLKQVLDSHGELNDALWNRIRNAVADASGNAA
jgi:hypothetical protein